jgi:hypothetical protein
MARHLAVQQWESKSHFGTIRTETNMKLRDGREVAGFNMSSFSPVKHKSNGILQHYMQKFILKQRTWEEKRRNKHKLYLFFINKAVTVIS